MAERDKTAASAAPDAVLTAAELKHVEELVEQEEGATHRFGGPWGWFITALCVAMTLFHLYAAYATVSQQFLREAHVAFALGLVFLLFPMTKRWRNRFAPWDVALAGLAVWTIWHMVAGGDDFLDRAYAPDTLDLVAGGLLVLLTLEATRRTTGLIMPVLALRHAGRADPGSLDPQGL